MQLYLQDRSDIASGYKSFTFTMPVSELGKEFSYSVRSAKTGQWSTKDSRAFINGILEKTGELPTPDPRPDTRSGSRPGNSSSSRRNL